MTDPTTSGRTEPTPPSRPTAPTELTGRELREDLDAWPLLGPLGRKEAVTVCTGYDPRTDTLSASVRRRIAFETTYAAEFRVRNDLDLPAKVLDAVRHNHMPQFTLRNIGRAERSVDLEDPLPFQRRRGIGHDDEGLLDEVRHARLPRVEMAQIWSVDFSTRMRAQLRRLLLEDPWELRYGAEAKANFGGPLYRYIVEGTHPDDLPDADWGPEPLPPGERWQGRDLDASENVQTFHRIRERILGAGGDRSSISTDG